MPSEKDTWQHQKQLYIPRNGCFLQVTQLGLGTLQSQISLCTTVKNYAKSKWVKSWVRYLQGVSFTLRRWVSE